MLMEFNIGDTVKVDRYNRKGYESEGVIVGHEIISDNRILYHINIDNLVIKTTGSCIVESKLYSPTPDKERHGWKTLEEELLEDQAWFERYKLVN